MGLDEDQRATVQVMLLDNMQTPSFEQRVFFLSKETIKEFLFSPIHTMLIACIIALISYMFVSSINKLDTLSTSVNHLHTSIQLLNSSLVVMDDRTHKNEESIIEIEKKL